MPCYTVLSFGMLCQKRLGYAVVNKALIYCFVIIHKKIYAMLYYDLLRLPKLCQGTLRWA